MITQPPMCVDKCVEHWRVVLQKLYEDVTEEGLTECHVIECIPLSLEGGALHEKD